VASVLATASLVHFFGKSLVTWLVAHGVTGVAWRAVVIFAMLFVCYTLFVFGFWATSRREMRTGGRPLRSWLVASAWLAGVTGWWIVVDRSVTVWFPHVPPYVSGLIEGAFLVAGMSGLFLLADRVGRRLGVNVWGVKREAA
jgi:hypothetical protein